MQISVLPHLVVRHEWLALHEEEIIEPDLAIVDPHHHLFDHPGLVYMLSDLLKDVAGHRVCATVAVEGWAMYRRDGPEALRPVGETEFLNGLAAMSASGDYGTMRIAAGIVGHADLCLGEDAAPVLEAHVRAGGGRFRGVRYAAVWHSDPTARGSPSNPPPGVLADPRFRAGFAQLEPLGLSFDAWIYHTQLAELVDLARAYPQTMIVLDHMGGVIGIGPYAGRRDATLVEWREGMRALARCPNVYVKIGGMGMRLFGLDLPSRPRPPSSQDLADAWRPYVETCVELFGAARCMFESNFPVDKPSCSYAVMWNAFKRIAAGATESDKHDLFSGTATRVYRL